MLYGYAGKIGLVDLSESKISVQALNPEIAKKYLGGKSLGAYLLLQHLSSNVEPYAPENVLLFITGPLSGTSFPAASRSAAITRSPITGTFSDSYCGGFFGPHLKRAGFDTLIIRGKASRPVYLLVAKGTIRIESAAHLWGLTTAETEIQLLGAHKKESEERISVSAIGPAGENRVRFANISNNGRFYGRGGMGAVMGSKNLKAVVLIGNLRTQLANEKRFKAVVDRCRQQIADHPMIGKNGIFQKFGTMETLNLTQESGTLPTRNWQENTSEHSSEINAEALAEKIVQHKSCYACPVGCARKSKAIISGVEYVTQGPEYETMFSFGSNCDMHTPDTIIAADKLCADYGLDTISCGGVIGFAMECFEKKLITHKDTGGVELAFGNGEALIETIHLIAQRKGIGRILAEGVKIASEKISGSAELAIHVKGLELPGYDPRGMKGQGITYAVSDRGGCHLRSNTLRTELIGKPRLYDRYAYAEKPEMVRELQLNYATFNCMIACVFGAFAITLQDYAEALSAITGWPITTEELLRIGERALNLTRLFNIREGFTRKDDTLPQRLFKRPSTRGPSKGEIVDKDAFEKMLDEYYTCMGWDPQSGIPSDEKLSELGIQKTQPV